MKFKIVFSYLVLIGLNLIPLVYTSPALWTTAYLPEHDKDERIYHICDDGVIMAFAKAVGLESPQQLLDVFGAIFSGPTARKLPSDPRMTPSRIKKRSIDNEYTPYSDKDLQALFEEPKRDEYYTGSLLNHNDINTISNGIQIILTHLKKMANFVAHSRKNESNYVEQLSDSPSSGLLPRLLQAIDVNGTSEAELYAIVGLQPFLATILSPTFLYVFSRIIKPTQNIPMKMGAPKFNIGEVVCDSLDYAYYKEFNVQRVACGLTDLLGSFAKCAQDPPLACERDVYKELIYSPPQCLPKKGKYANKVIDMATAEIELEYDDERASEDINTYSAELFEKEGFLNFILFRSSAVSKYITDSAYPCGKPIEHLELVPGWKIVRLVKYQPIGAYQEEQQKIRGTSMFVISIPKNTTKQCEFLLTTRGTSNSLEWVYNLYFEMEEWLIPGGLVHSGYKKLADMAIAEVLRYFRQIDLFSKCKQAKLFISGISLGGALSLTVSAGMAHILPQLNVTGVAFAPPLVFNQKLKEYAARKANIRTIINEIDLIGKIPCGSDNNKRGLYFCNSEHYNPNNWKNFVTDPKLHSYDGTPYFKYPLSYDSWFRLGENNSLQLTIPIYAQLPVVHGCLYTCRLSRFCLPDEPDDTKLWECATSCLTYGNVTIPINF